MPEDSGKQMQPPRFELTNIAKETFAHGPIEGDIEQNPLFGNEVKIRDYGFDRYHGDQLQQTYYAIESQFQTKKKLRKLFPL